MKFSYFRMVLFSVILSFLVACSGGDSAYKSDIPITPPSLQERMNGVRLEASDDEAENEGEALTVSPEFILPPQINLDVPFFSQAPEGDWSLPWQEACEESSLLLAHAYATGKSLSKEEFKRDILAMVDWQNEVFGDYQHTTVDQTAQMLEEFLNFKAYEILENPIVEDLKTELAQGRVIVAPFAGRQLGNPFYSGEGPRYHMLVIRGYDESHFITNDVGTRRGENFIYPYATLLNALHDWHETDMNQGEKKVIVLRTQL